MDVFIQRQSVDLAKDNPILVREQPLIKGDANALQWVVMVTKGGVPVNLAGATATLYCARGDGEESSGGTTWSSATATAAGVVTAILPQDAANVSGPVGCALRITRDGVSVTVARMAVMAIDPNGSDIIDVGKLMPNIDEVLAAVARCDAASAAAENAAADANKAVDLIDGRIDAVSREITDLLDVENTKNLYNKNGPKYQYGIGSANLDVQTNSKNFAIIIDVLPNTTYTFSGIRFGWNICYEFAQDAGKVQVGSTALKKTFEGLDYFNGDRGYKTFTTTESTKAILVLYWRDGVDANAEETKREYIQLENGEKCTDYVQYGRYSERLKKIEEQSDVTLSKIDEAAWSLYLKNITLFCRKSNGFWAEHPTWWSRQYEVAALCAHGRYIYTGSHLGFKKWDTTCESDPIDITQTLSSNRYLQKNVNQDCDQWSINPWGTGGGERIPYKMEYYNGYIYAIARGGSGFVADDAEERKPNTNAKGETEIDGTVGYFIIMDTDLNVIYKEGYYGSKKTEVGYRKPAGFVICDEKIYISCQLYGWMCYNIKDPVAPTLLYAYSPLDESVVVSINGADLSSKCGPIEYQNGCIFMKNENTYYTCAGYVDGIHVWDVTDISAPTEIKNDIVTGDYGLFWQFRIKENKWNTFAHLFDVEVIGNKMYATVAPTTTHGNDEERIAGLIVLDIEDLSAPTYKYYPISKKDWNYYRKIGDVKPSHLLVTADKILLNNGNKGIAVYDNSGDEPVYRGCITSDGDEIYQMVKTDDGRLISGCHIAPYNFRINRGIN